MVSPDSGILYSIILPWLYGRYNKNGRRGPGHTDVACSSVARTVEEATCTISLTELANVDSRARYRHQSALAPCCRRNKLQQAWRDGIRQAVLERSGYVTTTGGVEAAARLLSKLGGAETIWFARLSQMAKWLRFCDEGLRATVPAREGEILAYIGYLPLYYTVSGDALPQCISTIFKYCELHHLPSQTKTSLTPALVRAYKRQFDNTAALSLLRSGCPATIMCKNFNIGLAASNLVDRPCCSTVIMALICQLQSVTVGTFKQQSLRFETDGLTATFHIGKG